MFKNLLKHRFKISNLLDNKTFLTNNFNDNFQ